jgi:hypothetical protein
MFFIFANLTLAGVLLIIGILTLKMVSHANEIVFASLPLLFGLHQLTQAFVWLGLYQLASPQTLDVAATIFVFYAQAALPLLVPLAIWLLEPAGVRKHLIAALLLVGGLLAGYVTWGLSVQPTSVFIENDTLVYTNPTTSHWWIAFTYILTTCGSLILSRSVTIQIFGWMNLLGLLVVYLIAQYSFTALWCLYAALVSCILYLHFIERRIAFLQTLKRTEHRVGNEIEDELERLVRLYPMLRKIFVRPV